MNILNLTDVIDIHSKNYKKDSPSGKKCTQKIKIILYDTLSSSFSAVQQQFTISKYTIVNMLLCRILPIFHASHLIHMKIS